MDRRKRNYIFGCKATVKRSVLGLWDETTLVPVWSATKGLASVCVLKILDEEDLSLDTPVVEIWPRIR